MSDASQEVEDLVRRFMHKVKPSGQNNLMAVCPFHVSKHTGGPERTPSFAISTKTGLFLCHSCKERGNLRQLLKALGVPSTEINKKYRLLLEATAHQSAAYVSPKAKVRLRGAEIEPLPESLLGLFDTCPIDLVREGFHEETLQNFDIGFDPAHMRITFPLRDMFGRLVGISGRSVTDDFRRYKVYDVEYEKWELPARTTKMADILWNVQNVYPSAYFGDRIPIVIVEGFKACMWLTQAGIKNVVALCGSYLKEGQLQILEYMGGTFFVMLDNNEAGKAGTEQVAKTLAKRAPTFVVSYDQEIPQPTDLTSEQVIYAIEHAQNYHSWAIQKTIEKGHHHGIRES